MIRKIISGGQTGVDRAALDVACELGIPRGGWCPKGRLAEDGPLHLNYPLKETRSCDYEQRTEWNVRDSDGTLVIHDGIISDGTHLTIVFTSNYKKPCLQVDLNNAFSKRDFRLWIKEHRVYVLNVAGPREAEKLKIFDRATGFLRTILDTCV